MKKTSEKKQPLTPEQLGELYPTPKTYDEIQADTEARQEYYDTIRTRVPAFKIAFFGTILFAAIAYYASSIELLWMVPDMYVIGFSYAVWAVLFLFLIKWLRYTANIFYEYASPMLVFWIIYALCMGGALFAWRNSMWLPMHDQRWLLVLIGVHFVVCYISAKICVRKNRGVKNRSYQRDSKQ
jgi:hypothetical protein